MDLDGAVVIVTGPRQASARPQRDWRPDAGKGGAGRAPL